VDEGIRNLGEPRFLRKSEVPPNPLLEKQKGNANAGE
jgi:hypothetical protein